MSQKRHIVVNDTLGVNMYSVEYERKMSNGLHSSFLTLYCVMIGLFTTVGALWATIDALWNHRTIELLVVPVAVLVVLLCLYGVEKAQAWGLRNLAEARAIADVEHKKQFEETSRVTS